MRAGDVMQDPFYSRILLEIERTVHRADEAAKAQGLAFTDSQIVSVLTKANGIAEGKGSKLSESLNPRDQALAGLLQNLTRLPEKFPGLENSDWIASLRCVIDSAKLRKGSGPGARSYLDYLCGFIADAESRL